MFPETGTLCIDGFILGFDFSESRITRIEVILFLGKCDVIHFRPHDNVRKIIITIKL